MLSNNRKVLRVLTIIATALVVQISLVTTSMAKVVMTDLGTLGGLESFANDINENGQIVGDSGGHAFIWQNGKMSSLDTNFATTSSAIGISEKGQIVGAYQPDKSNALHAAILESDKRTDLGTLGGNSSYAKSINEKGQVVGNAYTANNISHAFIWENGKMIDLGTLGGNYSQAESINEKGQVVGYSYTADNKCHAFIWGNGKMTDLGALGGDSSYAKSINEKGQVAGYSYTADNKCHAFIWENGKMTDLGTLGGNYSFVKSINEKGQVIGYSYTADNRSHAFIWENGKMIDLGTLGGNHSYARAINEKGQVVGYSYTADNKCHAFIWKNGKMTDLGIINGIYSDAAAINDKCQVVGWDYTSDYKMHACMWEIIPDNSITPSTADFDPSNPEDITVTTSKDTLLSVKNGTITLDASDYATSESAVKINKNYLASAFTDPKVSSLTLTFDFATCDDGTLTINRVLQNSITCNNTVFNLSNPKDMIVNISGNKLLAIKNGSAALKDVDYSVSSGGAVTINKNFLTYFFTKFNYPLQKLNLVFDFEKGNDLVFTATQIPITNFVTCSNPVFDLLNPQDITLNIKGSTVTEIKNGPAALKNPMDYSISGNTVTIKKGYLTYFFTKFTGPWQKLNLEFDFEKGNDPLFIITKKK